MIVASALERRWRENLRNEIILFSVCLTLLFPESSNFTYLFLPLDELAHRVALDALRAKVVQLDGLPEEGQTGLVSQHVLDLDVSLALLAELGPMPG